MKERLAHPVIEEEQAERSVSRNTTRPTAWTGEPWQMNSGNGSGLSWSPTFGSSC